MCEASFEMRPAAALTGRKPSRLANAAQKTNGDIGNLIELDRPRDAMDAIGVALAINPKLSVSAMQLQFAGSLNHPENRRIWLESLKKAGLPDR